MTDIQLGYTVEENDPRPSMTVSETFRESAIDAVFVSSSPDFLMDSGIADGDLSGEDDRTNTKTPGRTQVYGFPTDDDIPISVDDDGTDDIPDKESVAVDSYSTVPLANRNSSANGGFGFVFDDEQDFDPSLDATIAAATTIPNASAMGLDWYVNARAWKRRVDGLYENLLTATATSMRRKTVQQVEMDCRRTASVANDPIKSDTLKRVLLAYAARNPLVGYCQGMNYIVAVFLAHLPEEDAFWLLTALVESPKYLCGYYTEDMLGVQVDQQVLQTLVALEMEPLSHHLAVTGVFLPAISAQWFICMFTISVADGAVESFLSMFFKEGGQVLFKGALALLKEFEPSILKQPSMHEVLQTIQSNGRTAVTDLGALIERHSDVTGTVTLERVSLLRRQYVDVIKESLSPDDGNLWSRRRKAGQGLLMADDGAMDPSALTDEELLTVQRSELLTTSTLLRVKERAVIQLTDEVATLCEEAAVRETQILLLKEELQRATDGSSGSVRLEDGDSISGVQLVALVEEIRVMQMSVNTKKNDLLSKSTALRARAAALEDRLAALEARALSSDVEQNVMARGGMPATPNGILPSPPFAQDQLAVTERSYLESRLRVLTSELDEKQLRVDCLTEVCRATTKEKDAYKDTIASTMHLNGELSERIAALEITVRAKDNQIQHLTELLNRIQGRAMN